MTGLPTSQQTPRPVRPIALHLPQFHPIPENDRWWGEGFTEWTQVRAAAPRFPEHVPPGPPGELGEYDLRDPRARAAQAGLARAHGVHAFCHYHYWFHGRRLLETPVEEMLRTREPDFPFLLCWANESWTRRWDGRADDVLMEQRYSAEDDVHHARYLLEVFADPRYVTVRGRPLFLVYRPSDLPDAQATAARWRREADRLGRARPFLAAVESFESEKRDWREAGFDVNVEFQPDWWNLGERRPLDESMAATGTPPARLDELEAAHFQFRRYDEIVERMLARDRPKWPRIPCVTPRWDNTPRRGDSGLVLHGSTPELFERWLREVRASWLHPDPDLGFVFLNSWNEWAEGAYLEPDEVTGRAYLEALRRALA